MFLVFSAGLGVLKMAVQAVSKMSGSSGTAATKNFFLIDKDVWFWPFLSTVPAYICSKCICGFFQIMNF